MNSYKIVRTKYKSLPDCVRSVLKKLDGYPFKSKGIVPFAVCNPTISRTFKVNRDGCHIILKGLAEAGYVKIHALRGVEVLSTEMPGDGENEGARK